MVSEDIDALVNFSGDWPVLAIPLAGVIYLVLRRLYKINSTNAIIIAFSIPGVVQSIIFGFLDSGDSVFWFVLISIFFIPANIFAPIFLFFGIFRFWSAKAQKKPFRESSVLSNSVTWLFSILYVYEQIVVFSDPFGS